ncbi:MAG: hypothetical protein AB1576_11110 [Bacillota bacterium]
MRRALVAGSSVLVLGVVLGASLTLALVGHRLETLMMEGESLIFIVQDREAALGRLRQNPSTHWITVRETSVILENDSPDRKVLEDGIKGLLASFIGRRVEDLDPVLVYEFFHGRLVEAGGAIYTLEVRAVFISPRLSLYIAAAARPGIPVE